MNRRKPFLSWRFWLLVCGILFFCFGLNIVASVILLGGKMKSIHPRGELLFYSILLLLFAWLCCLPVLRVLRAPVIKYTGPLSRHQVAALRKTAKRLHRDESLPHAIRVELAGVITFGKDPKEPVRLAVEAQTEQARGIIREQAVVVLLSTAISQNGQLDSISVFVINLRLVHRIVEHFGSRPPLPLLLRIYAEVLLASLLADSVEDINFAGALSQASSVIDIIPGTRLVIDSALDGTFNALLTLRIGFATVEYLTSGARLGRSELRRRANKKAFAEIWTVLGGAAANAPNAIKSTLTAVGRVFGLGSEQAASAEQHGTPGTDSAVSNGKA